MHAAGVRHVFGYPGESIIDFMEAARNRGIQVVSAVREGTAAFMAEAAAMASGRPGVCLSTLGPGSTAVLNGVASATLDRVLTPEPSRRAMRHAHPDRRTTTM